MGLISGAGKIILIVLNIAFMIVAIGILIVGVILKFFPGTLLKFLFDAVTGITQFQTPTALELKNVPMLDNIGMALLILGLVLFCVAFMACCGACCEYKILLLVYIIIMTVMTLVITVIGGLFLDRNSSLHTTIREQLKTQMAAEYKGPQATDSFSLTINILSYSLKCCGMTGTSDFSIPIDAAWKKYEYKGQTYDIDVTPACCKEEVLQSDTSFSCAREKSGGGYDQTKTNTQGCYDKLLELMLKELTYAILGLVCVIALLIILVIFAVLLLCKSDNKIFP